MSVKSIIDEAKKNSSGRKTKNSELYFSLIAALCQDDDYVAKNVKEIKNGDIITEDLKLAPAFKKIIITVLKKNTSMSEAEATAIANEFKMTAEQAKTLSNIVHEADYLAMKECNKKVQLFRKSGFDISMTIEDVKERVRSNPQDKSKQIKIKAHDRVKIQQTLHAFQKEVVKGK
jgi:hypothetical protein